jgi:prevent-host-death family protein
MKRTVSAVDARQKLGELLESVYYRGDEIVIERAGKVMAVVVPAERYAAMERSRERFFARVDELHERNRDVPHDVIEREIALAVKEVRSAKRRGGSTRKSR